MQSYAQNIIKKLAEEGHSPEEIKSYLQGLYDGMTSIKDFTDNSKMEITKEETDPLYAHTWNNAVNALSKLIGNVIKVAFNEVKEELELGEKE